MWRLHINQSLLYMTPGWVNCGKKIKIKIAQAADDHHWLKHCTLGGFFSPLFLFHPIVFPEGHSASFLISSLRKFLACKLYSGIFKE